MHDKKCKALVDNGRNPGQVILQLIQTTKYNFACTVFVKSAYFSVLIALQQKQLIMIHDSDITYHWPAIALMQPV
jgi:hypothetical protein